MLRRTEFFECEDTEDLLDALESANARSDGGRSIIKLTGTWYVSDKPMFFEPEARITFDMNGLGIYPANFSDGWVIKSLPKGV